MLRKGWLEGLRRAVLFCWSISYPEAASGLCAFLGALGISWNETATKRFIATVCWHCVLAPSLTNNALAFQDAQCFFQGRCASWNLTYLELFL